MESNEFQSMRKDELRAVAKNLGVSTRVDGTKKWRTHADLVARCTERARSVSAQPLASWAAAGLPESIAKETASVQTRRGRSVSAQPLASCVAADPPESIEQEVV